MPRSSRSTFEPSELPNERQEPQEGLPRERPTPILRALIIGLLLVPLNILWVTVEEQAWYAMDGTSLPLFITPVFFLFLLVVGNIAWRKLSPRYSLTQSELLLVYIMLVISCTFCGQDTLQNLFGQIGYNFYMATPENRWRTLFFSYLPHWLQLTNKDALRDFYEGRVSIYSAQGVSDLRYWILPLAAWGVFFLALFGMYLCINVIIERRWIEDEKLAFPIVQLPLAITDPDAPGSFFANPIMWAGFAAAFLASGLNGLHDLFPTIPNIPWLKLYSLGPYLQTKPWNSTGLFYISLYPFSIGIAYFMPLDLSFSCWFFYLLSKVYLMLGDVFGWDTGSPGTQGYPFMNEQTAGAWIGLALMVIISGRRYIAQTFRLAFARGEARALQSHYDPGDRRRYRASYIGLAVGVLFLAAWSSVIGLTWWVAIGFFVLLFVVSLAITRVRAELGAPHEIQAFHPDQIMVAVLGSRTVGVNNLAVLSMFYWMTRGFRNDPMPNQLEALKMTHGRPIRFSSIITVIVVAAVVSLLVTYWANLHVIYAGGADAKAIGATDKQWVGGEANGNLVSWIQQPARPETTGLWFMAGALIFVVALSYMRREFLWWPFHPAGYALAVSYAMTYFWMPTMVAWLAKLVITRYGGPKAYRNAIPFFLGLILGDYTVGSIWALIGVFFHIPTYKIYI